MTETTPDHEWKLLQGIDPLGDQPLAVLLQPSRRSDLFSRIIATNRNTRRYSAFPRLSARRSRRKLWVAVGASTAALIGGIITAVVFLSSTVAPAFAVTVTSNNSVTYSVTVTLNDVAALGSLNAKLAAENLPIRAVPVVAGCTATVQQSGTGSRQVLLAGTGSGPIGTLTFELGQRPPSGDTLIIGISSDGRWAMFPHEIQGPVPSCVGESSLPNLIPAHSGAPS